MSDEEFDTLMTDGGLDDADLMSGRPLDEEDPRHPRKRIEAALKQLDLAADELDEDGLAFQAVAKAIEETERAQEWVDHAPRTDGGEAAETDEVAERPAGPYDDATLVIYTCAAEEAEQEPTHDALDDLGLVSWSLWVRWEDGGIELPIVGEASWHMWFSCSAEDYHPDPADPVSDAFVSAVVEMVDEDVGDGWGDITDETWRETQDVEKYIIQLVRWGFLEMDSPQPALVIDWCQKQANGGER